jgi:predicted RNA-binding protein
MKEVKKMDEDDFLADWFQDIPHNADFYSHDNQQFFVKVLTEFNFKIMKPIVFLPCAKQKPISRSRTHCYLSAITRNDRFEKVILSEPQTIIPYAMEKACPNYDYPPGQLTERDRWQLVRRLGFFLADLKEGNPKRVYIYYIGGAHHAEILRDANAINHYFRIKNKIPERGIRDYTTAAKEFSTTIILNEGLLRQQTLL